MIQPSIPADILASVDYGVAAVDRHLRYVYVNEAALAMVGVAREAVLGRTPADIFPAAIADEVMARARTAFDTATPATYELHFAPVDRWYENRLFPWPGGIVVFFSDITHRKHAELALRTGEASQRELAAALRESRDVLALAMRGGRMGAWSRNLTTNEIWWSSELEEIFGVSSDDSPRSRPDYLQLAHPDDRPAIDAAVNAAIASHTDYAVEFRFRHPSGEWRWMEGRGGAIYAADGRPLSLYGVGIDITARKEAEHAVTEARAAAAADAAHLSIALSAAKLGDWRWESATDVVTMSPRAADIFDIAPGPQMTWAALRDLLHPDDRERARHAVEEAIEHRGDYAIEYRLTNQGRERWVKASGRAIYAADGRVTGMRGVVQDISHDRLLVRLDDAVRSLVDAEEITFTSATLLGSHLSVNRCAYAIVEDDQDAFLLTGNYTHQTHSIVGRYRFRQFGAECLRLMRVGEPYVVEDAFTDPRVDAAERPSYEATSIRAVICVPIRKEGRFVAAMAVHATTPRRWGQDEVQLVQQVASRCWESLERARVQNERTQLLHAAQAANRAKDEFMAILGHELRNPLSPILTALQLMRARGDTTTAREQQVIERQVRHLMRLVDDLLDVSRIARGKVDLKIERIDIADVIAKAVETASPLLEARQHTLQIQVPAGLAIVAADPARLTQVFSNLLTNAAKYTPAGGRILVTADVREQDVAVSVRDTGVGIAPDMLPHIFDAFVQGPQWVDRAQGGLGLGLTIVRSLVERHGGAVTAVSEGPGRGSELVVRLPLATGALDASAVAEPAFPLPAGNGMRVLVVDDNADAADLLTAALMMNGFMARQAHDPVEALRVAAEFLPQLAVLDIGLPVMDGYELARRLRGIDGLENIRLIAVSGYGQHSDHRRSLEAGFDHHLVKPVDIVPLMKLAVTSP